jgi:hypothetical protein
MSQHSIQLYPIIVIKLFIQKGKYFYFSFEIFLSLHRTFIPRVLTACKSVIVKVYHPCDNLFPRVTVLDRLIEPQFFRSASIGTVRYQSYASKEQTRDDSCVLFVKNDQQYVGRVSMIIRDKNGETLFLIQPAVIEKTLAFTVNKKTYTCHNILFGYFDLNKFLLLRWYVLQEKLAYVNNNNNNSYIFFRFPNLVESS